MFAFVVADRGPSDEGIPAIDVGGAPYPLVGADLQRCESYYGAAEDLAQEIGRRVELRVWNSHNRPGSVIAAWGISPDQCQVVAQRGSREVCCDSFGDHEGDHEWHIGNICPGKKPKHIWART